MKTGVVDKNGEQARTAAAPEREAGGTAAVGLAPAAQMRIRESIDVSRRVSSQGERLAQLQTVAPVRQLKTLTKLSNATAKATTNKVYFSDGPKDIGTYWEVTVADGADRTELLKTIAARVAQIASEIDATVGNTWNFKKVDAEKKSINYFDPIMVRVKGKYDSPLKQDMELDYHFGNCWHGYVIRVVDTGKGINKTMHAPEDPGNLNLASEYSNIHDVAMNPTGPLVGSSGADEVTKLAGEGARWNCIGANVGIMRDDTKIYTNDNKDLTLTDKVRFVTFPVLWKSWKETFGKGFGIQDGTVREKLVKDNLQLSTQTGVVDEPVNDSLASSSMNVSRDLCVDDQKPAQQIDLAVKELKYLHFKSKPVASSKSTLQQITSALSGLLSTITGVSPQGVEGYLGDNVLICLCEVGSRATIVGDKQFTFITSDTELLKYPAYQAPKAKDLAKRTGSGAQIAKGDDAYLEEKQQLFDTTVQLFVSDIQSLQLPKLTGVDIDNLVRTEIMPWSGDKDDAVPLAVYHGSFKNEAEEQQKEFLTAYFPDPKEESGESDEAEEPEEPKVEQKSKSKKDKKKQQKKKH